MAGATLCVEASWQARYFVDLELQVLWQAQTLACSFRGRCSKSALICALRHHHHHCPEICTSRFTSRSPAKVIRSKSTSKEHIKMRKRSFRSRLPPISENEPHVQSPRFTAPATKSKHAKDHSPSPKMCTAPAQSPRAPAQAHQILQACALEMHFEDLEVNECTVNSSELAGHGCEHLDP